MADFFDKMIAGINKGVNSVSEGSKTMIEKAKINSAISDAEKVKRQIAEQIGVIVYGMYQKEQEIPEALHSLCLQMAGQDGEIEEFRTRLAALDMPKAVQPPTPQMPPQAPQMPPQAPQTPPQAPATPAAGFCPECGFPRTESAKFCHKCGKAL